MNQHPTGDLGTHISQAYDDEMTGLQEMLNDMAIRVDGQLTAARVCLKQLDMKTANEILPRDQDINELLRRINSASLEIMVRRQPMAIDLRMLFATLRIATELERLGDYARNIAQRVKDMAETPGLAKAESFRVLSQGICDQMETINERLQAVMRTWWQHDADEAVRIRRADVEIDRNYESIYRSAITYILQDARQLSGIIHMMFIAKMVERCGDKIADIAEHTYYMVKGNFIEDEEGDDDS